MNLKKTKRQITAVNNWIQNKAIGTIVASTGFGKTMCAIIAIKKAHKKKPDRIIHVVVPTVYLKNQWESELKKYNIHNTEVFVVNTYVKDIHTCDLLILDESHNYVSKNRIKVFQTKYKFLLSLTATPYRRDGLHDYLLRKAPIIDSIQIDEAHAEGYVSDFIVYNLGIELSPTERKEYDEMNKAFFKHFAYFGMDFKLAMQCMGDKEARLRYAIQSGYEEKSVGFHAIQFNRLMQRRKNFLYKLETKLTLTKQITQKFNVKTITFSETTDVTDELTNRIQRSVRYHSGLSKKEKIRSLELFNSGECTVLNTAKALDEGFDAGDIELGIITSCRAVERVDSQRRGRIIRFRTGKLAVLVNIYIKNTRDEQWLKERQKNTLNTYWIESIDEIKFERPKIKVG